MDLQKIEQYKKLIKNAGVLSMFIGFVIGIGNTAIYLWSIFDESFSIEGLLKPNLTGVILALIAAFIFIILGNRIRNLADPNIKKYLYMLTVLVLLFLILIFAAGGTAGALLFVVVFYLVYSIILISKLMKAGEFTSTLKTPDYKIKKKGWIIFIVIAVLCVITALIVDSGMSEAGVNGSSAETVSSEVQWKGFTSDVGKFKMLLPVEPIYETQDLQVAGSDSPAKAHFYVAEVDKETAFIVNFVAYPVPNIANPEELLQTQLKGMVESAEGNELISSGSANFQGYKTLDFLLKTTEGLYMRGRSFVAGKTMYQLIESYEGQFNEDDYNRFISSFELTP